MRQELRASAAIWTPPADVLTRTTHARRYPAMAFCMRVAAAAPAADVVLDEWALSAVAPRALASSGKTSASSKSCASAAAKDGQRNSGGRSKSGEASALPKPATRRTLGWPGGAKKHYAPVCDPAEDAEDEPPDLPAALEEDSSSRLTRIAAASLFHSRVRFAHKHTRVEA